MQPNHSIITASIGFLIESNHDKKQRNAHYQRLQPWLQNLQRQKIPYYFLVGNTKSSYLSPDPKKPLKPLSYFYHASQQKPHILYGEISQRIEKTKINQHLLQVDLPPCPQYRSIMWWVAYYYLIYQYPKEQQTTKSNPQYWIQIPDHCWVNLEKINRYLRPESSYHYLGNLSRASREHTNSSITESLKIPYLRPDFGGWFDGERGLILSQHALRCYLSPLHVLYIWTDAYPDKALGDVLRFSNIKTSFFTSKSSVPVWMISAKYPIHKPPSKSWFQQCLFVTHLQTN